MPTKLPRCFFTITVDGMSLGTVIFELCSDICPKTCENFMCLCTGEKGRGSNGKLLTYKGSSFHRIVKNFMIQGGDFTHGSGVGGESIYGGVFADENFILKHDQKYLLSMANRGANTNGSQFFITTALCPHLDNSHVVFGHVVDGEHLIDQVEKSSVDADHKPFADIRIMDCGMVPGYGKDEPPEVANQPLTPLLPVAPLNVIPLLQEPVPEQEEQSAVPAVEEEKKKKKKKKKSSSSADSSSDSCSDSDSSDDSSDESSDSDNMNKKLKKKKKKLLKIKKKLEKMAKKKKLKKSRAKKLKRVEEKIKKIDKIMKGDKLTESEESGKEELKNSFLYRSSQSPPPKKKIKKRTEKPKKKEEKILDEEFFAKRGKIAGTLLAPMSQLHGMGHDEYSMTGPTDSITSIVNRSKTNVEATIEKNQTKPQKTTKKKASKKAASSSSSDSDSSDMSESSEEEKKKKKKKKATKKELPKAYTSSAKRSAVKTTKSSTKSSKVSSKAESKTSTKAKSKSRSRSRSHSRDRKKSSRTSQKKTSSSKRSRSRSRSRGRRSRSGSSRRRQSVQKSRRSRSSSSSSSDSDNRYSGICKARGTFNSVSRGGNNSTRAQGHWRGSSINLHRDRSDHRDRIDHRDRSDNIHRDRSDNRSDNIHRERSDNNHRERSDNNFRSPGHRGGYQGKSYDPNYRQNRENNNPRAGFVPRSVKWDSDKSRAITSRSKSRSPSTRRRQRLGSNRRRKAKAREAREEEMEDKSDDRPALLKTPLDNPLKDDPTRETVRAKAGLRSKWSDDEDTVKIVDETPITVTMTMEDKLAQTKAKVASTILSEYTSPKINFS